MRTALAYVRITDGRPRPGRGQWRKTFGPFATRAVAAAVGAWLVAHPELWADGRRKLEWRVLPASLVRKRRLAAGEYPSGVPEEIARWCRDPRCWFVLVGGRAVAGPFGYEESLAAARALKQALKQAGNAMPVVAVPEDSMKKTEVVIRELGGELGGQG